MSLIDRLKLASLGIDGETYFPTVTSVSTQPKLEHFSDNIEGWFDFSDVYSLMVQVAPLKAHFVEVGTWKGKSASYMAVEIANSGKDIRFDVVDHWGGSTEHQGDSSIETVGNVFNDFVNNTRPVEKYINTVSCDSVVAASAYTTGSLDFVFIDGSHEYEAISADIRAWFPKVKVGGYIGFHDYEGPIEKAVRDSGLSSFGKQYYRTFLVHKTQSVADTLALLNVSGRTRLFDTFMFFNELDTLEIRLRYLWDVVDRFVLVEATRTHSGSPKPLYFKDNLKRFDWAREKIIHVVVEDLNPTPAYWENENRQRGAIMRGLISAEPEASVMTGDLDEIPSIQAIALARNLDVQRCSFCQQTYCLYFNNRLLCDNWHGTVFVKQKDEFTDPVGMRGSRDHPPFVGDFSKMNAGGWHLAYMGGAKPVQEKIAGFAHTEYSHVSQDMKHIENVVGCHPERDILGRTQMIFEADDLPPCVPNDGRYDHHILKKKDL